MTKEFKKNFAAFLVHDFHKKDTMTNIHTSESSRGDLRPEAASAMHNRQFLEDYNQMLQMESIIVDDLVKPLAFLFKYFLPFHNSIAYDPVSRSCVLVKSSYLRKVLHASISYIELNNLDKLHFPCFIFLVPANMCIMATHDSLPPRYQGRSSSKSGREIIFQLCFSTWSLPHFHDVQFCDFWRLLAEHCKDLQCFQPCHFVSQSTSLT